MYRRLLIGTALTFMAGCGDARSDETIVPSVDEVASVQEHVTIADWVTDLKEPWGFAFTGANDAIVTEKRGTLRLIREGQLLPEPVKNIPTAKEEGQGGLLDVALDPNYAENGWVYLSYAAVLPDDRKKLMTEIARGRIQDGVWTDNEVIFRAKPEHYVSRGYHFGSRVTFDKAGHLYFSVGDRGEMDDAQDITKPNGKVHRINRDGSVPDGNPFVGRKDAYESIWSYGNRNPQGLIVHPDTGVLWETEHGPRGGDELNAIVGGQNYGWPKISYGINYSGTVLTPYKALPDMEQPASQWTPSIAACGLDVYTGNLFPEWKGRLLAGALAFETVRLIHVDGSAYKDEVTLIEGMGRVRDVTTGPDGAIYVALPNKIVRITPK